MCFCASGWGHQRNDCLKVRGSDLTPSPRGRRLAPSYTTRVTGHYDLGGEGGNKGLGCRDKTK